MRITRHSGIYTLETVQWLLISLDQAWDFFSNPANLAKITPEHMGFRITSPQVPRMYTGQIITYRIAVLPGIPVNWVTEITHVEPQHLFVDEQRKGPYRMWHHEHRFVEKEGGVQMIDRVSFQLPMGFLGHLAFPILVKKQLHQIFEYRRSYMEEHFGQAKKTEE